jgi:hypothetical protein
MKQEVVAKLVEYMEYAPLIIFLFVLGITISGFLILLFESGTNTATKKIKKWKEHEKKWQYQVVLPEKITDEQELARAALEKVIKKTDLQSRKPVKIEV